MTDTLTIRMPDDMHVHLRDGSMLAAVLPYTGRYFRRAIVMPNLTPGVKKVHQAAAYMTRIKAAQQDTDYMSFEPLMTLYLTEETTVEDIENAKASGFIHGFKYYPRGATTNSAEGVRSFDYVQEQLKALERVGMPLLIHGEDNFDTDGNDLDPFDKERHFIEFTLPKVRAAFPKLRIVLEHITTREAAEYMARHGGDTLAATVTPHHLVADRRALFAGGLNPHFFCLPVLKRTEDMKAIRHVATHGYPFVFAGTDSAPHPTHKKEQACGCAGGCFVAPIALSMYAQVFEEENALTKFEAFMSENGAYWYGLPLTKDTITLVREKEPFVPENALLPFFVTGSAGEEIDAIRIFGTHPVHSQALKWHWRVKN